MKRGRPFQAGNTLGHGRPKGSRNKINEAGKLLEEHSATIMALAISKCRETPSILRQLLRLIAPKLPDAPINLGPVSMDTLGDLDAASRIVLAKTVSGKLSLNEAQEVFALIETRRRVLFGVELERRVSAVEQDRLP
ncbi:MAG TPA: hypothetical protein VN736_13590 [Candidatus Limnocylindrales bacterium]|nr:hypothetical protein [Candidatus Limnocylindrales bacterium]